MQTGIYNGTIAVGKRTLDIEATYSVEGEEVTIYKIRDSVGRLYKQKLPAKERERIESEILNDI